MTWVPVDACSLPTVEQPLRAAKFDDLFRDALEAVELPGPTTAVLRFAPVSGIAARARDLGARETECCSFFAFDVREHADGPVVVTVTVPGTRADVLDALADRARTLLAPQP